MGFVTLVDGVTTTFSCKPSVATTIFWPSSVIIRVSNVLFVIIRGTSPLMALWACSLWLNNSPVVWNPAQHNSHMLVKQLDSTCVFWCFNMSFFWLNGRPQRSQTNGFSPVCLRQWTFKAPRLKNVLPQNEHSKFLTPVCLSMCWDRLFLDLKPLLHTLHLETILIFNHNLCNNHCNIKLSNKMSVIILFLQIQ